MNYSYCFCVVDQSNPQFHSGTAILSQSSLTLKNIKTFPVLFKIQTTSPLNYRVKPSHGRIEAGEGKEINSKSLFSLERILKPTLFLVSMSSDSKKTDKFLVSVVPLLEDPEDNSDFNSQFNQAPEEFVQKYRLRCLTSNNLLSASGGGSIGTISSPVAPNIPLNGTDSMASINSSIDGGSVDNLSLNAVNENVLSSPAISTTASTSAPSLQRDLKEARSEIDRLKLLLKNGSDWKNILSAQYGAPPVLVILVAIFAFMIGLLF